MKEKLFYARQFPGVQLVQKKDTNTADYQLRLMYAQIQNNVINSHINQFQVKQQFEVLEERKKKVLAQGHKLEMMNNSLSLLVQQNPNINTQVRLIFLNFFNFNFF